MGKLFGADGIRGVIDRYPFRMEDLDRLGYSFASWWLERSPQPGVLIGTDTRESNQRIKVALVKGLSQAGVSVFDAGILPTAAVSYLIASKGFLSGGLMISASHNPLNENGIKMFDERGMKLDDRNEAWIEANLTGHSPIAYRTRPAPVQFAPEFARQYAHDLAEEFKFVNWRGRKIAIDCANGAAFETARWVFDSLGLSYVLLNHSPNGANINRSGGSEHARLSPTLFASELKKYGVEVGLALDGDADRVALIDDSGRFFDGDLLLAILGLRLKRLGALAQETVVITQMSNSRLEHHLRNFGIHTRQVKNGDKYITAALVEDRLVLGGEQIGHLILHDRPTRVTGDGLRTALWVLAELALHPELSLDDLSQGMQKWPQVNASAILGFRTQRMPGDIPGLEERVNFVRTSIPDLSRLEVRPASTEPVYRIMLEASQTPVRTLAEYAYALSRYVQRALGALDHPVQLLDCGQGGLMAVDALHFIPGLED